jgi:hypothetical protein
MFWRKFKLDWSYAIGELFIVTIGVLIALGINQWQQDRGDRVLELQYANRLKADLQTDINRFNYFEAGALSGKTTVLKALAKVDGTQTSFDHSVFNAENLNNSTFNALPRSQSATFNELQSTGNFKLLQNSAIRMAIDHYYNNYELMSGILFESLGPYSDIFVGAMPGAALFDWRVNEIDLSDADIDEGLHNLISHPDYRVAVNSELAYTSELIYYLRDTRLLGEALLTELEKEYPTPD